MDHSNGESKHPAFRMNWKGAVALLGGLLFVLFILSTINVAVLFSTGINLQYQMWFNALMNIFPLLGAILAFDFFIVRRQTGKPLNFNFRLPNLMTLVFIFPMMIGMMFIAEFFTSLVPTDGPVFGEFYNRVSGIFKDMMKDPILMFIMLVISAPILEEIIFRGIIQKGLINNGSSPKKAIFIAAIFFAVVHGNPWQFVGAILLGSFLGYIYHVTKSLLVPILLHAFNNGLSYVLMMGPKVESFYECLGLEPWQVCALGLIIFGSFYYLFNKKYKVHYLDI